MDLKIYAEKIGFEEDEFRELAEIFVATTKKDIEKIRAGLEKNSHEEVASASHSIKGASGNLGFDEIFLLAKKMEMQARDQNLENFNDFIIRLDSMVDDIC